jgi:hypothetical protein
LRWNRQGLDRTDRRNKLPGSKELCTGGSYFDKIDTVTLPETGSYTLVIDPTGANIGSITAVLYDVAPDVSGSIVIGGPSVPVSTETPGQGARLTFSGIPGQSIRLTLSSHNFATGCVGTVRISILNPGGTTLKSPQSICNGGGSITASLSADGNYTVVVDPEGANEGSITLTLEGTPGFSAKIYGLANVGQTLVAAAEGMQPAAEAVTYQWRQCDSSGASCADLPGETSVTYIVREADLNKKLRVREVATNSFGSTTVVSDPTQLVLAPVLTLLASVEPELRYAQNEGYRADSAAGITNSHSPSPGQYSNYLKTSDGFSFLAASDPTAEPFDPPPPPDWDRPPLLTLDFLQTDTYPSGSAVNVGDFLDEHNGTEEVDAQYLHTHGYGDVVYGRYVQSASGEIYLQYWFFYYYNPKQFSALGIGEHEGDWEMVQYRFNSSFVPQAATYSQHQGGETCGWLTVPQTASGNPVVYVGDGSHANYFWPGVHSLSYGPFTFQDNTDDLGDKYVPQHLENVTAPPTWLRWPGVWGASGSHSPPSPYAHGQWNDPAAFENGAADCTTPQSRLLVLKSKNISSAKTRNDDQTRGHTSLRQRGTSAPPYPRVNVHRSQSRVVVRYCFSSVPSSRSRRPWQIITAVDSLRRDRVPPLTLRTRVTLPCGRVSSPIGQGKPPLVVRVAIMGRTGAQTPSRTYRLSG